MLIHKAVLVAALLAATPAAAEFSLTAEWGNIPRCNTGRPNMVASPRFVISNLPQGTQRIEFALRDLNAPDYNHGGGSVAVSADGVIAPGAFRYLSPCPPGGTHTYQWTATAHGLRQMLGRASVRLRYP